MLLNSFSDGHRLLGMALLLRVDCLTSQSPMEKSKFSFANGYQLEIASGLHMGASAHISFQLQEVMIFNEHAACLLDSPERSFSEITGLDPFPWRLCV